MIRLASVILMGITLVLPVAAQQSGDILDLVENEVREHYREIARQREKARREEVAADRLRSALPDLSQYGTLAEPQAAPRQRQVTTPKTHCVTVDLARDMRATDCF